MRAPGRQGHVRLIAAAAVALAIVGGAVTWRVIAMEPVVPKREAVAARNPVLDELVASTKALENSQQQAIDQLQVLQDAVAAQQAETRHASDQVALLNGKLDALRQSFAEAAVPAVAEKGAETASAKSQPDTTARATTGRKVKQSAVRSRGRAHRVSARKTRAAATRS